MLDTTPIYTTIVFAPAGSGKSKNAEAMEAAYGLSGIIPKWSGDPKKLKKGALHLTTKRPEKTRTALEKIVGFPLRIVSLRVAEEMVKINGGAWVVPVPDRLCVDPRSSFFNSVFKRIAVRFDGELRKGDVHEYCISEGWIMVRTPGEGNRWKIENGEYVLTKLKGRVQPFVKPTSYYSRAVPTTTDVERIAAAEDKRARKAAKLAERGRL
jgi:hypothetical protein